MSIEYVITFGLISAAGVIIASVLNAFNFARLQRKDSTEEAAALATSLATMATSLKHIEESAAGGQQDMHAGHQAGHQGASRPNCTQ